jgi:hypothetical protein
MTMMRSVELMLDGNIPMIQTQTPMAHTRLISWEERRRMIRTIRGMLKKGKTTAETSPNVLTRPALPPFSG